MKNVFIEAIISISISVPVIIVIIKFISKKIIENQFEKSMEKYKFKLESEFDRISKIHQKEFEILPDLWQKFIEIEGLLFDMSKIAHMYPDLDGMNEEELNKFLDETKFNQDEKLIIKKSQKPLSEYIPINYRYDLRDVYNKIQIYRNFMLYNKIFLEDELVTLINSIDKILSDCISKLRTVDKRKNYTENKLEEVFSLVVRDLDSKKNDFNSLIKKRLHFDKVN